MKQIKRPPPPPPPELKKGTLLVLKVPPYYSKEYMYEVTSAGDRLIRATLYHSPTVKKQWTIEEFQALLDNGIVRIANEKDLKAMTPSAQNEPVKPSDED